MRRVIQTDGTFTHEYPIMFDLLACVCALARSTADAVDGVPGRSTAAELRGDRSTRSNVALASENRRRESPWAGNPSEKQKTKKTKKRKRNALGPLVGERVDKKMLQIRARGEGSEALN